MARMRSLKPEFWHDQEITRLPRDARLLYMAMWNLADEHSRLQGDPRYLKGQAFPYDDDLTSDSIAGLLELLIESGKVERYVVRAAVYLLLPKLAKHQRLDTEKVPSRLPSPEESAPLSESFPNLFGKNPDQGVDESALSMLHVAGSMLQGESPDDSPTPTGYCKKHPGGTDENCGPCGAEARRLREWKDAAPERARKRKAIADACPDCGGSGWIETEDGAPAGKCDHQRRRTG